VTVTLESRLCAKEMGRFSDGKRDTDTANR
jgi:hypothetical protein